jgi:D-tyrosyl-tRNA(Tyr) deacylase
MKLVIQRVSRAAVRVNAETVSSIGTGILVLVGLERGDGDEQVERAAAKVASLRAFEDEHGRLNLGLEDVGGEVLAVSQFTLAGSIRRGRRPSFDNALPGEEAGPLFDLFVALLRRRGLNVGTGEFGALMEVELVNHGPVTLLWNDPPDEKEPRLTKG